MMTSGYLIYRLTDDDVEILGIYESEAKAKREIEVLEQLGHKDGWRFRKAPFIGWGHPKDLN
jgi:hypothetical protein